MKTELREHPEHTWIHLTPLFSSSWFAFNHSIALDCLSGICARRIYPAAFFLRPHPSPNPAYWTILVFFPSTDYSMWALGSRARVITDLVFPWLSDEFYFWFRCSLTECVHHLVHPV